MVNETSPALAHRHVMGIFEFNYLFIVTLNLRQSFPHQPVGHVSERKLVKG